MKVFLDTNVWLSAIIFPGLCESLVMACARLVAAAVTAGADLFVSGDKRVLEWIASGSLRIASPRQAE
jgi:predicted nucleic acid-binding protein